MKESVERRLFVPMAKEPFIDFRDRGKEVEVRKCARQYTLKTIYEGSPIELRLGYSGGESIWGNVGEIVVGSWEEIFEVFDLSIVEPRFQTVEAAIRDNELLMGITMEMIAFRVKNRELKKRM